MRWKDQGWGNQKGHLWARVSGGTPQGWARSKKGWARISSNVAQHSWTRQSFALPPAWFAAPSDGAGGAAAKGLSTLELAYEVGGGGGHELRVQDAQLTLEPRVLANAISDAISDATPPSPAAPGLPTPPLVQQTSSTTARA